MARGPMAPGADIGSRRAHDSVEGAAKLEGSAVVGRLVPMEVLVRVRSLVPWLASVSVLVLTAPLARADRVPCRPPLPVGLTVQSIRALEVHAPADDRDVAIARVSSGMSGFHARIERCLQDRGATAGAGRMRARLRYERSERPIRSQVVENGLGSAAGACVSEVLPSLLVRPAPRGELTIEITLARGWSHRPY